MGDGEEIGRRGEGAPDDGFSGALVAEPAFWGKQTTGEEEGGGGGVGLEGCTAS